MVRKLRLVFSDNFTHLPHTWSTSKMTTMREFCCDDMFRFNNVNMDKLTETVRSVFRSSSAFSMADWKIDTCMNVFDSLN